MAIGHLATRGNPSLVKDSVAWHIRDEIISGRLAPGDSIVEAQWARKLNVAQASIRAALNILESEGFVQQGGRSLTVTAMSPDDIAHTFQVRTELEAFGARLVASRGPDLSELDQIVADMRSAVECRNLQAFYERDLRFHLTLCRLAGNPVLEQILKRLLIPLFAFVVMRTHDTMDDSDSRWTGSVAKHEQIVKYLRAGSPERVEEEVSAVIDYFSEDIYALTLRKNRTEATGGKDEA